MASAMVPEVKVFLEDADDDRGGGGGGGGNGDMNKNLSGVDLVLIPEVVLEAPLKSPQMLAPPPRFSPDDDDEESAWVDFDSSGLLDYPELLSTYSSLRPRLSYR